MSIYLNIKCTYENAYWFIHIETMYVHAAGLGEAGAGSSEIEAALQLRASAGPLHGDFCARFVLMGLSDV